MKTKISKKPQAAEADSTYLLKIVLYIILGSFWLKLATPVVIGGISISAFPLGLIIGLFFASHDHFQIDRKVEYALLLIVAIITLFLPTGIVL